jgi:T5SS/PEP-CTERM-associated repeat protein
VRFRAVSPEFPATYTLVNPLTATPGLVIGHGGRDIVWLILSDMTLHATNMTVGHLPDGTGHVTQYADPHGTILVDQNLIVGNEGVGVMELVNVTMASAVGKIGQAASARGDVTLYGSEMQWDCEGPLTVGMSGEGTLTINNQALVACHDAIIGQHEDSAGAVSLSSAAQWSIDGTLDVGMTGFGSLYITSWANVTNHTFATIGTYDSWPYGNGGVGEVTVDYYGSPSWTIDGDLYIGFFGAGSLSILGEDYGDGSVIVSGDVSIGLNYTSTLMLTRGGTITIGGNLTNYDHEFDEVIINIRYADDYLTPAIDAGGTIDSFEPEIILHYYYEPQVGDTFAIAHADGGLDDFSFILPELPAGFDWEIAQDEHDVALMVVEALHGDINDDGHVNTTDLLLLLAAWGECDGCPEDINGDGVVNTTDLLTLLANWTG